MSKVKFKKRNHGCGTTSECGRFTITRNADFGGTGWSLHCDDEFEGDWKTKREAIEQAQIISEED